MGTNRAKRRTHLDKWKIWGLWEYGWFTSKGSDITVAVFAYSYRSCASSTFSAGLARFTWHGLKILLKLRSSGKIYITKFTAKFSDCQMRSGNCLKWFLSKVLKPMKYQTGYKSLQIMWHFTRQVSETGKDQGKAGKHLYNCWRQCQQFEEGYFKGKG